jgi:DNA-directed RNA polymerase specialized sigma24 family protein
MRENCRFPSKVTFVGSKRVGQDPDQESFSGWYALLGDPGPLPVGMEATMRQEAISELGDLFRDESSRLWRAVLAFSQDEQIASDAVAEAFAQCLRRGAQVRDPRAWVWRAAFRIAAGELKKRGESVHLAGDLPIAAPESDQLLRALRALAPMQRAALLLHYYGGYDAGDVGRPSASLAPRFAST